jgi:hypothetical protein
MTPRWPVAFLAVFFLASAGRAQESPKVDLSFQFPDAAGRSQKEIYNCHDFASVALLEAALFRRHGKIDGEKLRLSEGDLFVGQTVANAEYFNHVKDNLDWSPQGTQDDAFHVAEGDSLTADLNFALAHGVAPASAASWETIKQRYAEYRKQQLSLVEWQVKATRPTLETAARIDEQVGKDLESLGADIKNGYSDALSSLRQAQLQRVQSQAGAAEWKAGASFDQWLSRASGKNTKEAKHLLLGDDPKIDQQRARVRELLSGFSIKEKLYAELDRPQRDNAAQCGQAGQGRKERLLTLLRAGLPVGVGMDIGGLIEWFVLDPKPAPHAFVVTGFKTAPSGKVIFTSRNSKGGFNPDVREDQLCRVHTLIAVLTDKER